MGDQTYIWDYKIEDHGKITYFTIPYDDDHELAGTVYEITEGGKYIKEHHAAYSGGDTAGTGNTAQH